MFEGSRCNEEAGDCSGVDRAAYTFPTFEYCHFDYDSTTDEHDACGDRAVTGLSVIGEINASIATHFDVRYLSNE